MKETETGVVDAATLMDVKTKLIRTEYREPVNAPIRRQKKDMAALYCPLH